MNRGKNKLRVIIGPDIFQHAVKIPQPLLEALQRLLAIRQIHQQKNLIPVHSVSFHVFAVAHVIHDPVNGLVRRFIPHIGEMRSRGSAFSLYHAGDAGHILRRLQHRNPTPQSSLFGAP